MQPESTTSSASNEDACKPGRRAEYILVWAACLIAGLRIFLLAGAFPFFNNVDEKEHFDLLLRYVRSGPQLRLTSYSSEAVEYITLFGSPEYSASPTNYPDGKMMPPIWMMPRAAASDRFQHGLAFWPGFVNQEGTSAPLYYSVAALWWRMGEAGGLEGIDLLYWVRFLNIFLGMALVWLGFWAARIVFPASLFPRLAVVTLLAFFPQDTFYSIESDVLSPVLFGLAFIGLLKLWRSEKPSPGLAALTGLALAGTTLVKATNLPLLLVSGLAVAGKIWQLSKAGKLRSGWPAFGWLAICALLPVGIWMSWNYHALGEATGTAQRNHLMTWTTKPLSQWFSHPLFSLSGEKEFWRATLASFWRGEFCWARERLASPWADAFYCISSVILLGANLPILLWGARDFSSERKAALWTSLGCFAAMLALLAYTSVAFDFGRDVYPSRARPLLTSGRLLSGTLIPFLLLYAQGLDRLFGWRGNRWARPAALAACILVINFSEIDVNRPAFSSLYNFFHRVPLPTAVANVPTVYLRPAPTSQ